MLLRITAGLLLAGTAWSASSQEYNSLGQGFAATGWSSPGAYGTIIPAPTESQNRTQYDGEGLLEAVTDLMSGDLDKQLDRELDAGLPAGIDGPTPLVGE